jgi:hypothetical protein
VGQRPLDPAPRPADRSTGLLSLNKPPLPLDVVRDLLAIARALYLATPPEESERRAALIAVGDELKLALELARRGGPGSIGNSAAWNRAEEATRRLCSLVDAAALLEPVVSATAERFRRKRY